MKVEDVPEDHRGTQRALVQSDSRLVADIKAIPMKTDEDAGDMEAYLRSIKTAQKEGKKRKESVTKPLNGVLREVRSWFKPHEEILAEGEALCKRRLLQYSRDRAKKQQAALDKALKNKDRTTLAAASRPAPKPEGLTTTKRWRARVINPALVPDRWKMIDEQGLNAEARKTKAPTDIPGVEFYQEEGLSAQGY